LRARCGFVLVAVTGARSRTRQKKIGGGGERASCPPDAAHQRAASARGTRCPRRRSRSLDRRTNRTRSVLRE
jgi:hypothetical protein